jgi:hypothetical protein
MPVRVPAYARPDFSTEAQEKRGRLRGTSYADGEMFGTRTYPAPKPSSRIEHCEPPYRGDEQLNGEHLQRLVDTIDRFEQYARAVQVCAVDTISTIPGHTTAVEAANSCVDANRRLYGETTAAVDGLRAELNRLQRREAELARLLALKRGPTGDPAAEPGEREANGDSTMGDGYDSRRRARRQYGH